MHARMHASPYGSQMCKSHQFDPQMWGGLVRARKWSCCDLLCVRFLFGIEQEENRWKLLMCESPAREPEMAGACACARNNFVCTCMCVRICVYFGVCLDVCKLVCANVCAHAGKKGCSISNVSNEQGGEGGSCINYRQTRKNTCDD